MRHSERAGGCARTGWRNRRCVRLRTGPGYVRGPLRGRREGRKTLGWTEGEGGENAGCPTLGKGGGDI